MQVTKLLQTKSGSIVISIILGLGLAALFRRACKNNTCIVVKGPNTDDVQKFYYKVNNDCYKYEAVISECSV